MVDHKPIETNFTKVRLLRRYDIFDLLSISLFNAVVFGAGLVTGWFIWVK